MGKSRDSDDDYLAVWYYCNKLGKKKTVITSTNGTEQKAQIRIVDKRARIETK
jgi:hypothetical protein